MSVCTSRGRAFTLIEMLVVMGIIAILMGLLFPVLEKVKDVAKRTRARTEVRQLALAWNSYLGDYRTWFPGGSLIAGSIRMMDRDAVRALSGVDTVNNRRGVMFYEFSNNNTNFCDPWRKEYQVGLDPDYDNNLDTSPWPGTPSHGIVPRNVAVWSKGKQNGLAGTGTTDKNDDDIKSWQ